MYTHMKCILHSHFFSRRLITIQHKYIGTCMMNSKIDWIIIWSFLRFFYILFTVMSMFIQVIIMNMFNCSKNEMGKKM